MPYMYRSGITPIEGIIHWGNRGVKSGFHLRVQRTGGGRELARGSQQLMLESMYFERAKEGDRKRTRGEKRHGRGTLGRKGTVLPTATMSVPSAEPSVKEREREKETEKGKRLKGLGSGA